VLEGERGVELVLIGSAASLLEGDELDLDVEVTSGHLTVRSVAAQLAHPCPHGGATRFAVAVTLGPRASLEWLPEPTVVCAGGRHQATARIALAPGARAVWRDELVLGRSGEPNAAVHVESDLRADHGGRALLRDGIDTSAPGAFGPAVLGAKARLVGAVHLLGTRGPSVVTPLRRFELAGPGTSWRYVGDDPAGGRTALDSVVDGVVDALVAQG
jgi:urease accessory protein